MQTGDAVLALAGSVIERARELIDDGWVKGMMNTKVDGAPSHFCIEGALYLAAEETFGLQLGSRGRTVLQPVAYEVLNVARGFILDEVEDQLGRKYGSIPSYNDAADRSLDQVLSVLDGAARRLWDLSVKEEDVGFDLSKYVDAEVPEEKKQYLYAVLA